MAGKLQVTRDERSFEVEFTNDGMLLDGNKVDGDLVPFAGQSYHLIHNNKSFTIDILSVDRGTKQVELKVNGARYSYKVKDRFDLLLENLGMDSLGGGKVSELKAPMPGLVIDVMVEPGQEVQEDDALLILEAMKMENVLKSPGEGVVQSVEVSKGDAVEKNELLIRFE